MFTRGDCRCWPGKEKSKEKGPRRVSRCRMPAIRPRARRLLQRPKRMPAAQPERSARWWRPPRSLCLWGSQGRFPMRVTDIRETTQKEKKLRGLEVGKAQSWSRWRGWRWRWGLTTREAEKALTPPHSPGFPGPLDRHWKLPMGEGT